MKTVILFSIALAAAALSGCAVVPAYPYERSAYVGPRVEVVPAPVYVRPYYYGRWYYRR